MADDFPVEMSSLDGPVRRAFTITPDDDVDLAHPTRGIYVGTSGDLMVTHQGDTVPVIYPNLAAGMYHSMRVKKVWYTGTTAADVIGGY